MHDYAEPPVIERPMRGREMKTNIIPTDMLDTMKMVSAKKANQRQSLVPELETKGEKKAELYHEGYVDGKLYLVPDSNLEAMRDIVNFKMQPRRSTRYKHQTSFELPEYDHFRGKLHQLIQKIEEIESESEEEEEEEEEELAVKEKEEEQVEEEEEKEEEKVEEAEEIEEEKVEEEEKEEPHPQPIRHTRPIRHVDPNRLRFLISGHFQKDKEPIYIIQDFRGGPDLFRDQKADFYTKQREDDVDLSISGRFYDEKILEESAGKPKALNIKPHRILIDEKTSNVYEKYFEQVYKFNSADLSLRGEFIKSKITKKTTPFLTIDVKHKYPAEPNIRSEREEDYHRKPQPSTAVLVYKPEYDNPFARGDENLYAYPVFDQDIQSNAIVLRSSIAGQSPYLQNKDDQASSESADESTEEDETRQGRYINEEDLKTIVSVKPFDNNTRNKLANMANNNYKDTEGITYQEEMGMNKSSENLMYTLPYSKDLEHLDNTRYCQKKLKKKRKSQNRGNLTSPQTIKGSNSFPNLREIKVNENKVQCK